MCFSDLSQYLPWRCRAASGRVRNAGQAVLEWCRTTKAKGIVLHALLDAIPFWRKQGFVEVEDPLPQTMATANQVFFIDYHESWAFPPGVSALPQLLLIKGFSSGELGEAAVWRELKFSHPLQKFQYKIYGPMHNCTSVPHVVVEALCPI